MDNRNQLNKGPQQPAHEPIQQPGTVFTPEGVSIPPPTQAPTNQSVPAQTINTAQPVSLPLSQAESASVLEIAKKSKKSLILILICAVVLFAAGGTAIIFYTTKDKKSSTSSVDNSKYEAVADKFIKAIQNKDKATADAILSSEAKQYLKGVGGSESFYDSCEAYFAVCPGMFTNQFLSKAAKSTNDYMSVNGAKGKEFSYSVKSSIQSCNKTVETTSSLKIAIVQNGNDYLVDKVDIGLDSSNVELCAAPSPGTNTGQ